MVYMIWRECIPIDFYRYICEENNFIFLNGRDVNHPGVLEIVGKFIDQKKGKFTDASRISRSI